MKEIRVVTGVRLSPDTAELIVTEQSFGVSGDEFSPAGETHESRLSLAQRRAQIQIVAPDESMRDFPAAAVVRNTGMVPFEVTGVFLYPHPANLPAPLESALRAMGPGIGMLLKDRKQPSTIYPQQTREYYLPKGYVRLVGEIIGSQSEEGVSLVAYSGDEILGRCSGTGLLAIIESYLQSQRGDVTFRTPALETFMSLETELRGRLSARLRQLADMPIPDLISQRDVTEVEDNVFFLMWPDDFRVLWRLDSGGVEVIDILRLPKGMVSGLNGEHVGAAG
jgi:hypothetical protein